MARGFALLTASAFLMSSISSCEDEQEQNEECQNAELEGTYDEESFCVWLGDCYESPDFTDTDQMSECQADVHDAFIANDPTITNCTVGGFAVGCALFTNCVNACGEWSEWEP